jgi:hypothetical protein
MRSALRCRSALLQLGAIARRDSASSNLLRRSAISGLSHTPYNPWLSDESQRSMSTTSEPFWSEEWKNANLKATQAATGEVMEHVLFIECGMGCDQHGSRETNGATVSEAQSSSLNNNYNVAPML